MNQYKLIAFDMDGTLLTDKKRILPSTLESIAAADEQGKSVVICTGRPLAELRPYEKEFQHIRYAICECGAFLYDFREKRAISHHVLPEETIEKIIDVIQYEDMMPQALILGESYINREQLDRMADYSIEVYSDLYHNVASCVDDVTEVIRQHASEIEKINLYHATPRGRERTMSRLAQVPVEKTYAEQTSLELSPPGVTKGTGLAELACSLGIPMSMTIGVGDADNDVPLICAAGLGVAMGNGNEHAKAAASYITSDNEHDGCAEVIRKYVLD